MIVQTYEELNFYLEMYRDGEIDLLVIESRGGLGKSRLVEDLMRKSRHIKVNSHITPLALYFLGYEYQDVPFIFDDTDSLLTNDLSISLLKMICETRPVKKISWYSTYELLEKKGIPQTYETKSKVCLLTNDFKVLTKKISALKDRAWYIQFQPTDIEILNKINQIKGFVDVNLSNQEIEEVYSLIEKYSRFCNFSLRSYVKGIFLYKRCKKIGKKDWQEILLKEMRVNPKLVLLGSLMKKYNSDKERIKDWEQQGFSRRSFYDYKTKFVQKTQKVQECSPNTNTPLPKPTTTLPRIKKTDTPLHYQVK